MDRETLVIVKNRSSSMVVYRIPEDNIRREFASGETKRIPYGELEKLTYQAGGRELIASFLQVTSEEVTENLNVPTEPEYYMNEEQIKELIKNGTLAAFLDCLDFAPIGVIDLIKQYAVALPMNDVKKREALKNKTGFDLSEALKNKQLEETDSDFITPVEEAAPVASNGRRTTTDYKEAATAATAAAAATSKYKVVNKPTVSE